MDVPGKGPSVRPDGEMNLTLLLYGAVSDPAMLQQGFYEAEIDGLKRDRRVVKVIVTNRLWDVWNKRYDGLVCYFYSYTAIAALIARIKGRPAIATGGGEQIFRSMAPNLLVYAVRLGLFFLSALFVRRILATSSSDCERMLQLLRFGKNKIELSFHGVNAAEFVSLDNYDAVRPPQSMITICGMDTKANVQRKGLFRAIDFLAQMCEHYPDATLTVIGRTTCGELVRDYALEKGVAGQLIFAGYVSEDDKFRLLLHHRFYIQLSEYEGFGIGALEALAFGCQVIHTNVGGLRDTIADYGIIASGAELETLDVRQLPIYSTPDWSVFINHMSQFEVQKRAETLLRALGYAREEVRKTSEEKGALGWRT